MSRWLEHEPWMFLLLVFCFWFINLCMSFCVALCFMVIWFHFILQCWICHKFYLFVFLSTACCLLGFPLCDCLSVCLFISVCPLFSKSVFSKSLDITNANCSKEERYWPAPSVVFPQFVCSVTSIVFLPFWPSICPVSLFINVQCMLKLFKCLVVSFTFKCSTLFKCK